MVELLAAMTVLSIGLLAVFAMFESGMLQIRRASTVTTAASLADAEMEKLRAIRYDAIGLVDANGDLVVDGAGTIYKSDPAYRAVSSPANATNSAVVIASTTISSVKTVTGADKRAYGLMTYITWQAVSSASAAGRDVKLVTIVVRDELTPATVWARLASSFDESTGI